MQFRNICCYYYHGHWSYTYTALWLRCILRWSDLQLCLKHFHKYKKSFHWMRKKIRPTIFDARQFLPRAHFPQSLWFEGYKVPDTHWGPNICMNIYSFETIYIPLLCEIYVKNNFVQNLKILITFSLSAYPAANAWKYFKMVIYFDCFPKFRIYLDANRTIFPVE